ncbi:MAG: hypothetical protein ACXVZU_01690 [Methanobacteriaceae archaeon]
MPDMEGDKLGKDNINSFQRREFGFKMIAVLHYLSRILFIIIPFTNLFPLIINFRILAPISLIPLSLGIVEVLKKPLDIDSSTKFTSLNIASLFAVAVLINSYFIFLLK